MENLPLFQINITGTKNLIFQIKFQEFMVIHRRPGIPLEIDNLDASLLPNSIFCAFYGLLYQDFCVQIFSVFVTILTFQIYNFLIIVS